MTTARCECTTYGKCQVCRPVLPSPNRPRQMPDLAELPILSSLLDHPRLPHAIQQMADRISEGREDKVDPVDVGIGLYHFFAVLEGESA